MIVHYNLFLPMPQFNVYSFTINLLLSLLYQKDNTLNNNKENAISTTTTTTITSNNNRRYTRI